jgi:hypothetical protein
MKYFKIKMGFGEDDFISIDETELSKAIRAQVKGTVAIFGEGTVAGNSILAITPDWNRMMGWHRGWKLTSDNWAQISRKQINECRLLIENEKLAIEGKTLPPQISEGAKQLADKMRA